MLEIPNELMTQLNRLALSQNHPVASLVEEALLHYIAVEVMKSLREKTVPLAEAQGYLTDEDIFREVS
jgi:predicted transcriptional regulator